MGGRALCTEYASEGVDLDEVNDPRRRISKLFYEEKTRAAGSTVVLIACLLLLPSDRCLLRYISCNDVVDALSRRSAIDRFSASPCVVCVSVRLSVCVCTFITLLLVPQQK